MRKAANPTAHRSMRKAANPTAHRSMRRENKKKLI
jgi:hypothetical protein